MRNAYSGNRIRRFRVSISQIVTACFDLNLAYEQAAGERKGKILR